MKQPRVRKNLKSLPVAPTLLTLAGAACGFGAIAYAARVGPDAPIAEAAAGNHLVFAGLLIFAAIVFDALDGRVARWTKQTSEFGAQLDSLCDAINFGVAPAFLLLRCGPHYHEFYHPRLIWVIGLLYVLCAVLRLARFNVQSKDQKSHGVFTGLPSPAAAGTVAAFVFALPRLDRLTDPSAPELQQQIGGWLTWLFQMGLPLVVLAAALLMVSRVRYPHFARQLLRGRMRFQHVVGLTFAVVAIFAVHELAAPLFFCYYMLGAPLRALWKELTTGRVDRELEASAD